MVGIIGFYEDITERKEIADMYNYSPCGYHSLDKDGSILPIILNCTAVKDPAGNFIQSRSVMFKNNKNMQTEENLHETSASH